MRPDMSMPLGCTHVAPTDLAGKVKLHILGLKEMSILWSGMVTG